MEPKAIMFNGKVVVAIPDHVEEVMVLRKNQSYIFELPKDERRILGAGRSYGDENIIEPRRP